MTASLYRNPHQFSSLSSDSFPNHRKLLINLLPNMIHCPTRTSGPNSFRLTISILENRLNLSHILPKLILLLTRIASEMAHEPTGPQSITNRHENGKFRIIQYSFKGKLDIVANDDWYSQTLDGVKKSTRSGCIASWIGIWEAFFYNDSRLVD
ncbi:transducin/WD40 repeat-like superfamily protein [Striga asiatica]|uniref:Transducin/WD40 repeat-like superfamily protein n=1 Tax=Striga asiatica TaxID=4170 RepID=A0A5A7PYY8_STRAF|nr:transducin/WD40 repeat-like superfamily protein [Striga asiatica]